MFKVFQGKFYLLLCDSDRIVIVNILTKFLKFSYLISEIILSLKLV